MCCTQAAKQPPSGRCSHLLRRRVSPFSQQVQPPNCNLSTGRVFLYGRTQSSSFHRPLTASSRTILSRLRLQAINTPFTKTSHSFALTGNKSMKKRCYLVAGYVCHKKAREASVSDAIDTMTDLQRSTVIRTGLIMELIFSSLISINPFLSIHPQAFFLSYFLYLPFFCPTFLS